MVQLTCTSTTHSYIWVGDAVRKTRFNFGRLLFKCLNCGGFRAIDRLGNIQMIGPATLEDIKLNYENINLY